jgi:hypothetical protein
MGFDLPLRNITMKPVNNHRITFLSNGLLFTSALLFAAFNYSEKDTINKELDRVESTLVKYETQVKEKPKKIIKTKKVKLKKPINSRTKKIDLKSKPTSKIKEAKNKPDSSNSVTILPSPITFDSSVVYKVIPVKPEVVDFPDQEARFSGGIREMTKFIINNLELNRMTLYGFNEFLVHVEFVVDDFGGIHKIKVQGKHDPSIVREVKRMIQSMPKWIPGEVNGRSVSTRMYLPIRIDLQ